MADVIICFKFYRNRLRGFRAEGPKMRASHWLWRSTLQQVSTTVLPVMLVSVFMYRSYKLLKSTPGIWRTLWCFYSIYQCIIATERRRILLSNLSDLSLDGDSANVEVLYAVFEW